MSAMIPVTPMKIATILGTRPEIIKLSALIPLLDSDKRIEHILIHTGQHYDYGMDAVFFEELKLRKPHYLLNVGSHSQGKQTGLMLEKIEDILVKKNPVLVIVQGDTNSTLAGALAAAKLGIAIVHVEAGCRSFNRSMPEEINRVITDAVSSILIAPDDNAVANLKKEGVFGEIINLGSTAFDAAVRIQKFVGIVFNTLRKDFGIEEGNYLLLTLHRAENTTPERLASIMNTLNEIAKDIPIIFPIHPRTLKIAQENNVDLSNIHVRNPQSYLKFMSLLAHARFCITDSGGIQEEALVFNVPCLIPRNETEWMRLVDAGKNVLLGTDPDKIKQGILSLWDDSARLQQIKHIKVDYPRHVSEKIIDIIAHHG